MIGRADRVDGRAASGRSDLVDDRTEAEKLTEQNWVDAMAALRVEQREAYSAFMRTEQATYQAYVVVGGNRTPNSPAAVAVGTADTAWAAAVEAGRKVRLQRAALHSPDTEYVKVRPVREPAPEYFGPRRGGIADRALRALPRLSRIEAERRREALPELDRPEVLLQFCEAHLARAGQQLLNAEEDADAVAAGRWASVIASLWQKHALLSLRAGRR